MVSRRNGRCKIPRLRPPSIEIEPSSATMVRGWNGTIRVSSAECHDRLGAVAAILIIRITKSNSGFADHLHTAFWRFRAASRGTHRRHRVSSVRHCPRQAADFQHRIVDHEGDFPGVVVSPEAYAVTARIIAATRVGKLERHDQLFSFVTE